MKVNRKNTKLFLFLPIILGLSLILMLLIEGNQKNSILKVIISILIVIIPYIYTVLPILKERYKEKLSLQNRLSQNTFTDRQKDLQNLINLLNKNQVIQLTGNGSQCGKTWLVFKLIDYIKHSKDKEFQYISPLKKHFKNVYYLDMKKITEVEINSFFEDNIVSSKTLIISDHISKLDYIYSKLDTYKFTLILVTTDMIETKGAIYNISEFEQTNIPALQENINKNYKNIDRLNKQEIECLYNLTYGNIGKIHFLLEHQEYIIWIKQLAGNLQTKYDMELNNIQVQLFRGEYSLSQNDLKIFEKKYIKEIPYNNDLFFKFYIMKSDCEHLLNHYQNALDILIALKRKELQIYNVNNKVDILEAHYYKHLWQCDKALIILHSIQTNNICGLTDALGILVAKYFIDDLFIPYSNFDSLFVFLRTFELCKNSQLEKNDKDILKIMRNESIYLYYQNKYKRKEILEPINTAIEIYKKENNRLLANAYFVRAEINRIFQKYKAALSDYNKCLMQTEDQNIKIQVNIMKYYLAKIKKVSIFKSENILSKEQILTLCKNKNAYGTLLIRRINSIELEDPNYKQIIDCFEHRVMTIL